MNIVHLATLAMFIGSFGVPVVEELYPFYLSGSLCLYL